MFAYVYKHKYICTYIYAHTYKYMYIYTHVRIYILVCVYIHTHGCMCVCTCVFMSTQGFQKRTLAPLELELHAAVTPPQCECARN